MNEGTAHLYFHSPCFDGVVSAVLTSAYLEERKSYRQLQLHSVNYDLRERWLASELIRPCAVVDFLYHPAAQLWADHHATAFLNDETRNDYERRRGPDVVYDSNKSSCALLIWETWGKQLTTCPSHYAELIRWADRIDSARYRSIEEAILLEAPAVQINLALAMYRGESFSHHLVWLLRTASLEKVAARPEVQSAFELGRSLQKLGQERLAASIRLTDGGIAIFDVDADNVFINRYAPFYFYPEARYSAGIARSSGRTKLTAMRNPWIDFPSIPLGDLFRSIGGGGHVRVASAILPDQEASAALERIVHMITVSEQKKRVAA